MRVSKTTAWSLATAAVCALIIAVAWLLLVEPQRAAALESQDRTEAVRTENSQLQDRIEQLRVDYASLPDRKAELAAIREALPDAPSLAALLAAIDSAAVAAPVTLNTVDVGEAIALSSVSETAPAPAEESAPAAASDELSAEEAAAAESAAAAAAAAAPILAAIPVTVSSTGDYFSTAAFLKTLQTGIPRALLIESVTLDIVQTDVADGAQAGDVITTISGRVYAYVDPQSVSATPAPTATTVPATTPAPATTTAPTTATTGVAP